MIIRRAAAADRGALAAALRSDATFKPDEIAVALELIDASLAGSTDYELRVAEIDERREPPAGAAGGPPGGFDGRVVGYVCFGATPMTRATWDLYWIVVDHAARGKGVARALIAAMETELAARGGGHVRVETSETEGYGAARTLYAKLGYPEAARLDDFYAPGDALLIYYKRVAASPP